MEDITIKAAAKNMVGKSTNANSVVDTPRKRAFHLIGIGASAGGFEALREFFDIISPNLNASYVLIQHLSPNVQSLMEGLLKRYTEMPLITVDSDIVLESGHVYLISNKNNLQVEGNYLKVVEKNLNDRPNRPINVFFESLGKEWGDMGIAVILSGTGTDGANGIKSVKNNGGQVFVQSCESAKFNGMPKAALQDKGVVLPENIMAPQKIAITLCEKLDGLIGNTKSTDDLDVLKGKVALSFERIVRKISEISGIDFSLYRKQTIFRRLIKRMRMKNHETFEQFEKFLEANPRDLLELSKEFLIGVTNFFRDREVYSTIERELIPTLFKNQYSGSSFRIWVAGCSTGEEAYSFAMLCYNYAEQMNFSVDFKIFATDVDRAAVEFAGKGIYSKVKIADLYPDLRAKYFTNLNNGYFQVKKELRDRIVFAAHDVLQDPPFIKVDAVSCRNLMIYLKSAVQKKLLFNFQFALNKNGFLILGNSETVGELKGNYKKCFSKINIFQSISESKATPKRVLDISEGNKNYPLHRSWAGIKDRSNCGSDEKVADVFSNLLLEERAPICVFVNTGFDVLYAHGKIELLLGFPQRGARLNLLEMVDEKEGLIFRNGIRKVQEDNNVASYKGISFTKGKDDFKLDLRFKLFKINGFDNGVVLVEFFIKKAKSIENGSEFTEESYMSERVKTLEAELREAKDETQSLVEQLESSNEELQASNEELKASNEELQSTNEELQSVNEELFTVNTELQEKITDLTHLNNDIDNLLNSTEIGTIFLDTDLSIRKFTPSIVPLFNLRQSDIGRSILHFKTNLDYQELNEDSREVIATGDLIKKEIKSLENGHFFLMRILPYKTFDSNIEGVVLTFVNITDQKSIESKLREQKDLFLNVIDNMNEGLLVADDQGNWLHYNKSAQEIAGIGPVDDSIDDWSSLYGVFHTDKVTPVKTEELPLYRAINNGEYIENSQFFVKNKDKPEGIYIIGGGRPVKFFKNGEWVNGGVTVFRDISEVKKAQESAQWNELRYRHLAEASFDIVWAVNKEGMVLEPQPNYEAYTGHSWEEYGGWKWTEFIHKDDRDRMLADWEWALENKKVYESEGLWWCKSFNDYRYFKNKAVPMMDSNGDIIEWIGICADVTEQVLAQRKLRDSEERYQLVIEGIQAGVYDWRDLSKDETWWSPNFYKLLGYNPGEIRPSLQFFYDKLHPEDKEKTAKTIESAISSGVMPNMEYRVKLKSGKYKWFLASSAGIFDANGKVVRMAGCITDIDNRKKAQEKLQESEERFRTMSDAAPMFIWVANNKKKFIFFNKTWLDFRDKQLNVELAKWKLGIHPQDREAYQTFFDESYRTKEPFRMEYRLKRNDGEYRWILDTGKPHFDQNNSFLGFIGSSIDVTERRNAEENLKRSNRELEQFAYVTTHDLRAPTVNLKSLIKIFIKKHYVNNENKRWFEQIQTAVDEIHETLHDLINVVAFKKTLNERIEETYFNDVFGKVIEGLAELIEAEEAKVEVDFSKCESVNYIPAHLKSILSNLIANAIKYRDKNRPVQVKITTEKVGSFICLSVEDNACGIPLNQQEKIFLLFQRLTEEKEGKGIGLFITKSQVEAMGGRVELESVVGVGSTFKVFIKSDLDLN